MAALRGRNLLLRGLLGFASAPVSASLTADVFDASTGLDFCASNSGTTMLAVSLATLCWCESEDPVPDRFGGPAIEVSGTLELRGGRGKSAGKLWGW